MAKFNLESFLEWKSKLHSEYRGDKLMYDVSNYYKCYMKMNYLLII